MDAQGYLNQRQRATTLPHVKVTKEEFIRRLVGKGESQEKAEQMAMVAVSLGSKIEINNEMVSIDG